MGKVTNFKGIRNMNTIGMAIRFLLCSMVQSHCKWGKHYNFQGHPTTLPKSGPRAVTHSQFKGKH